MTETKIEQIYKSLSDQQRRLLFVMLRAGGQFVDSLDDDQRELASTYIEGGDVALIDAAFTMFSEIERSADPGSVGSLLPMFLDDGSSIVVERMGESVDGLPSYLTLVRTDGDGLEARRWYTVVRLQPPTLELMRRDAENE